MQKSLKKSKNPLQAFFQRKELDQVDLLCIYGFSKEVLQASKEWREKNKERLCVFIEEDPKKIKGLFGKKDTSLWQEDPQVQVHLLETPLQLEPLLKKICWNSLFLQKEVVSFRPQNRRFEELSSLLEKIAMGVELTFSTFSDFGLSASANVLHNLLNLKEVRGFSSLKGAFANIPAIVCGASPSLIDNLSALKKVKNQALIFGGGSALNVLSAHAVPFHFASSVDKEAPFERFLMQSSFETPFFYQGQASSLNLSLVHAPLVRVLGCSELPLEKWLDEKLGFSSLGFDGGWTVATFLLSLAYFLGCRPIIMLGMDFSFEKDPYARGVFVEKGVKREFLAVKDRKGKKVWTQRDWLLARSWIEEFAKKRPGVLIDASRGLCFQGVKRSSLDHLSKQWKGFFDLPGTIHSAFMRARVISLSQKKVFSLIKQLNKSLLRSEIAIDREMERGKKRNSFSFEEVEEKLFDEESYELLLQPLWNIWTPLFEKNASLQELALHRMLFFKRVIEEYKKLMEAIC